MTPFAPYHLDIFAFEEMQNLLGQSRLDLSVTLRWDVDMQEWECKFETNGDFDKGRLYVATHPSNLAKAILDAIEQVPK